ncbi:PaaX family transcriptional regulator C-terminal domain-containing protein [Dietzia sp. DQ12-76]|uniref:PaaX family transcriptional regulator C-terminal domain-containing protein n=1 Tax=Dietzia sp. DQ12-76 TaxID=1630639 RepID=UPI001F513BAB|nr:PaaX family transcriptional regulator C-terminal domain-containing protein [Dietzia sp. DQ12-76]
MTGETSEFLRSPPGYRRMVPSSPQSPVKLTARSAVLSVLLGMHPAEATAAAIIEVAVQLGFKESAMRVALTRMVAAGDLHRDNGVYRLSPRLIARQRRQEAALSPSLRPWDGQWSMQVVTVPADAVTRAATRTELTESRYAELREGVWIRPDNLVALHVGRSEFTGRSEALSSRTTVFSCRPEGDVVALTEDLFAPAEWSATGQALLAAADRADDMSARFELAAATVRHILHDPLLPAELLPDDWPGERLRESYDRFRAEFGAFATTALGGGH